MTKVVTFYSYKGGVGRTMALVNTAHVLARDGWRVLMVDFDLEAPGMTHFFADHVRQQVTPASKDALDLLLEVKRTLPDIEPKKRTFKRVSLDEYVIRIPLPEAWLETEETGSPYRNGRVDLLPATLDPTEALSPEPSRGYLERMDALDLPAIFSPDGPRHRFGDYVRQQFMHARFAAPGDILFTMREQVQAAYDIVLVDSRTGLNEISGLCIGPLSDALVVCVGLNQQNIEGTRYFMQKAGLLNAERSKPYALVAGPVPPWHTRVANERIGEIGKILKASEIVSVPYHPAAALAEKVFVVEEPNEAISVSYMKLAPKIVALLHMKDRKHGLWHEFESAMARADWTGYTRQIEPWLSSMRLRDHRDRHSADLLPALQQFATAVTIASVPTLMSLRSAQTVDLDTIVSGAAVAALRLRSHVPFERVWKAVAHAEFEKLRIDLAGSLAFMQLRVLQTMPQNAGLLECMSKALVAHEQQRWPPPWSGFWSPLVASAYAAELGFDVHVPERRDAHRKTVPKAYHWLESDLRHPFVAPEMREMANVMEGVAYVLMNAPGYVWVQSDFGEKVRTDLMKKLASASGYAKELNRIHRFDTQSVIQEALHSHRVHHERDYMVGFWPESIMVSVISLLKGPEAIDEILDWIKLCRLLHGYAWRVIVDWRHLKAVQDHPKLVAFLQEEDARVEKIEAAIDRGRYPL